jgi:hypothetical protein
MKAFIVALAAAIVLAVAAGFVLEGYFSTDAEVAFATSGARVGEGSSPEARGWFSVGGGL